jgi:hypothetical protein
MIPLVCERNKQKGLDGEPFVNELLAPVKSLCLYV